MIYVGIDVASEKHDFIIMDSNGVMYSKRAITIPNNNLGYKKLHNSIKEFCEACNDYQVRIGLESTGFYHENILNYLVKENYDVMVINPILTNMSKKSKKVHTAKNDNLDAIAICKYLYDPDTEFTPYTLVSYHTNALKSLSRERFHLKEKIRIEKQNINKLITKIFPEYLSLFSNVYQGSAALILKRYPSTKKISSAHTDTISSLIHGRCKVTAQQIKELAKSSIGRDEEYLSLQLIHAFNRLEDMEDELKEYDELILKYVKEINPNILSIPGVGAVTAGLLLGEIGDINRFKNVDNLVSFAGIDIEVYESGKYQATNYHVSKKGSKYLRYALFQVSRVIWIHDPTFNQYYFKKKAENKHHYVILGHIQKKLVRVIYSMLKSKENYNISQN